jgi:ATP-dependent DNA helicase Rep
MSDASMNSAQLNAAQLKAVRYLDGPCLVIAGAGSGKTRVITHKIRHLLQAGISPRAIAAITFTNKAAQEMAERLRAMVKLPEGDRPLVSTFHSLGVQMLREDGQTVGLKRGFSILDADDAQAIVLDLAGSTDRKLARGVQQQISLWKNAGLDPDQAAAQAGHEDEHAAARIFRSYQATLAGYQSVDFDDLIGLPLRMLRAQPEVAGRWQNRLRYLLVDEYQDTNAAQYELLKLLVGPRAAFTAVGDDDQSIYGWRGATLENLRRLGVDFPKLEVIKLEQNYRSSRTILAAANALIAHNPKLHEKRLWSELGVGDPVRVLPMDDDEAEAESIAMRLQALRFERKSRWSDLAVLYRGNHQARIIEQALRKEKIPYVLSGGQSFFERAEIRDICAYLRLLANDDDDPAFVRAVTTPKRGIGPQTLQVLGGYAGERQRSMFAAMYESAIEQRLAARQVEALKEFGDFINRIGWRAKKEPAGELLKELVGAIQYREHLYGTLDEKAAASKWQNVCDFVDWIGKRGEEDSKTLIELAQMVVLLSRLDNDDADTDAVRLTTIHASKGLEYPHVFISGCEEGLLPHTGDAEAEGDDGPQRVEEERRLMYVAVTRAQRTLTISWCRQRKRARTVVSRLPSRFIAEMGLEVDGGAAVQVSAASAKERVAALRGMLKG